MHEWLRFLKAASQAGKISYRHAFLEGQEIDMPELVEVMIIMDEPRSAKEMDFRRTLVHPYTVILAAGDLCADWAEPSISEDLIQRLEALRLRSDERKQLVGLTASGFWAYADAETPSLNVGLIISAKNEDEAALAHELCSQLGEEVRFNIGGVAIKVTPDDTVFSILERCPPPAGD